MGMNKIQQGVADFRPLLKHNPVPSTFQYDLVITSTSIRPGSRPNLVRSRNHILAATYAEHGHFESSLSICQRVFILSLGSTHERSVVV